MAPDSLPKRIASVPKAELHLHLEGSIRPATVCALAARHGVDVSEEGVRQHYAYKTFLNFLETFKWVTAFLRDPQDYALVAHDLGEQLLAQNIVYAEITLSAGVMLLRKQAPEVNFEAILRSTEDFESRGLCINWVFDAVRQFGADAAMRVLQAAQQCASPAIVAFGIGGDELSVPTEEFQPVYDQAANLGFHRLMHAGEIGGPEKIRQAIELLGAERIGHGIAAIHDPALMDLLVERRVALEICPQSNLCTGALALQLGRTDARIEDHPLARLFRHGIPVVLSTDDPAMFHTTLLNEYAHAQQIGLSENELAQLVGMAFDYAFVPEQQKCALQCIGQTKIRPVT
jgi:adenosine deaminase